MKEFVLEVRDIYGTKLNDYIIEAGTRDYAFEIAKQYSERDFPEYQTISISCINEEKIVSFPVKESEIDVLKRALNRMCIYFADCKESSVDNALKNHYEILYEIALNLQIKSIECDEEFEGAEND